MMPGRHPVAIPVEMSEPASFAELVDVIPRSQAIAKDGQKQPSAGSRRRGPFGKSTTGMVTLFHDLVYEGLWKAGRGSLLLHNETARRRWATTVWQGKYGTASLSWPALPCATFWALDQFIYTWNDFVEKYGLRDLPTPQEQLEAAVFAWIAAGTRVLAGKSEPKGQDVRLKYPEVGKSTVEQDWNILESLLINVAAAANGGEKSQVIEERCVTSGWFACTGSRVPNSA